MMQCKNLVLLPISLWMCSFVLAGDNIVYVSSCGRDHHAIILERGHTKDLRVIARGTGRTTGHIATLSVVNTGDESVVVRPQIFYIPSDGKYQSYVGRITEPVTIPPGESIDVPVQGYCTDVHTPPVPAGESMPPVDEWIPVGHVEPPDPLNPWPSGSTYLIPGDPVLQFEPTSVPTITTSDGYKPASDPAAKIIATWPGISDPVGGVFKPGNDPRAFASVVVGALIRIEEATDIIINSGNFTTPFSNTPARERESVIQQTFWIYCAVVTGREYEKSDFAENVYTQYRDNTGVSIGNLPQEQRDKVDAGVDDFWNVFQATGVQAKVLSAESPGLSELVSDHPYLTQAGPGETPPATPPSEEGPAECDCDSLTFVVSTDFGGLQANSGKQVITEFTASTSKKHKVEIELDAEDFPNKTKVNVSGITLYCTTCRSTPCHPYAPASDGAESKMTDDTKDKILISKIDIKGAGEAPDARETTGSSLSTTVTPDAKAANYFISFKISGTCMAPEPCKAQKCIRYVQVEVKPKKK